MATDGDPRGIVTAARGWIGTPYRHQASLKGVGCDCLGLLRGVWREIRGPEPETVPPYTPDWGDSGGDFLRQALARHLTPVADSVPRPGDVALFRLARGGPARHCGIIAARGGALTLIHARQNARVREEPFAPFWPARLACLFRV